jgi:SAM-dependent methyltransferase/uncharacterized protein YbaR (Trm112 family)
MKEKLLDWLACPACAHAPLSLHPTRVEQIPLYTGHFEAGEAAGESGAGARDVIEGSLHCGGCGLDWPISDGVPRLLPPGGTAGPDTGHRLTEFEGPVPQYEENFLDLVAPLGPDAFLGKVVLDAGCGFGRHAFFAARYGAEVIALDSSPDAVASAARNLKGLLRAHVVLGDIERPPLRRQAFDLVYCLGVLHHVVDPTVAFRSLDELVAPGGRLSVWAYGPRQGLTRIATGALRGATTEMDVDQLHRFSQAIAAGLRVFSHTPHRLLGRVPVLASVVTHLPVHDHSRWPFDVVVADVYDRLRIPVTRYFQGEELERWYADTGYADIQVTRRVRNTESFRATGIRR